jgi:hypothetical protein
MRDELRRSRLLVFFRLPLSIPHIVWLLLWTSLAVLAGTANWVATLVLGRSPRPLHRFLVRYVRYLVHVQAFLFLAGNPFPGFTGRAGRYPVDVEIDGPDRQRRWTVALRIVLVIPALLIAGVLTPRLAVGGGGSVALVCAILIWFVALVLGRAPRGLRDLLAYTLRYAAQLDAYLFVLTDRYPNSDPQISIGAAAEVPEHPVRLHATDDRRRSRLTVFFRLLLALPHLVWLALWSVAAFFAGFLNWIVTLVRGRSPLFLHRFLAAFVRYQAHVYAFLFLVANPFPGFVGRAGSYPVDIEIAPPERQNRWITGFRILLGLPALLVNQALSGGLFVAAFLGWFAALVTGRMPHGLRNLGGLTLRYSAQTSSYLYLLTDRYPYSGPSFAEPVPLAEPE